MAKPIFLVKVSWDTDPTKLSHINKRLMTQLDDWHVLVVAGPQDEAGFFAYNADKLPDVDIEELKKELSIKHEQLPTT